MFKELFQLERDDSDIRQSFAVDSFYPWQIFSKYRFDFMTK